MPELLQDSDPVKYKEKALNFVNYYIAHNLSRDSSISLSSNRLLFCCEFQEKKFDFPK